jgi:Protein of unknown function (DUF2946)
MRRWLSLMMLVVFAARCLVPAGFMLEASSSGDGTMTMVICTGQGTQMISVDADGKPLSPKPAHIDNGLCAYSASGTAALASFEQLNLETQVYQAAVTYRLTAQIFRATPKPGATSARGPPSKLV